MIRLRNFQIKGFKTSFIKSVYTEDSKADFIPIRAGYFQLPDVYRDEKCNDHEYQGIGHFTY